MGKTVILTDIAEISIFVQAFNFPVDLGRISSTVKLACDEKADTWDCFIVIGTGTSTWSTKFSIAKDAFDQWLEWRAKNETA